MLLSASCTSAGSSSCTLLTGAPAGYPDLNQGEACRFFFPCADSLSLPKRPFAWFHRARCLKLVASYSFCYHPGYYCCGQSYADAEANTKPYLFDNRCASCTGASYARTHGTGRFFDGVVGAARCHSEIGGWYPVKPRINKTLPAGRPAFPARLFLFLCLCLALPALTFRPFRLVCSATSHRTSPDECNNVHRDTGNRRLVDHVR